jgi:signal transduction histidine kinase
VRAHQQAIIAELGLRARTTDDLTALLDDGVTLAARALRVELATLAELSARGEALIWRSAYGWTKEAIASAPSTSPLAGSLERYTVAAGTAVTSEDVGADERFQVSPRLAERVPKSVLAVLVPGRRDAFGVLVVAAAQRRSFTSDESNFMQAVANVLGLGVERSRAEARLDEVRERERSRIARDLHDEALGELSDVLARASLAQEASSDERDREQWDAVTAALQRVFARLRSSIYDLRLGDGGDRRFADLLGDLVVFQGWMARPADVQLLGQEVLPRGSLGMRGIEVLRIVREAITNARRHSGASSIRVDATQSTAAALRIMVSDDGTWAARSSTEARPLGAGTLGMLERAEVLGAELQIERPPSGGTIVSLELPLERGEEARGGEGALGA